METYIVKRCTQKTQDVDHVDSIFYQRRRLCANNRIIILGQCIVFADRYGKLFTLKDFILSMKKHMNKLHK